MKSIFVLVMDFSQVIGSSDQLKDHLDSISYIQVTKSSQL